MDAPVERIAEEVLSQLRTIQPAQPVDTDVAPFIDHTLLRPDATSDEIDRLCAEAVLHGFASVCVQPCHVSRAADRLAHQPVAVGSVVGFPHGATLTSAKRAEAEALIEAGATELDMVLPVGLLKDCRWSAVADDITAVVGAASGSDVLVKVIIEACLLTDREKVIACVIAESSGADYVKTSTGYADGGATVDDVALMKLAVGDRLGVKAAGGVRTREVALAMIAAGATRLGTSSGPTLIG
jgi:deoxyribose-phosphate aldolase